MFPNKPNKSLKFVNKQREIIEMRVDGMDCNNCAMSIHRFLERKGLTDVLVNFQTKNVSFRLCDVALDLDGVRSWIKRLCLTLDERIARRV